MEFAPSSRRSYLPWILAFPARLLAGALYRVSVRGAERVPLGGALLLSNHLSYVDAVVLQLACPRPIRFVGHEGLKSHWLLRWILNVSGTIAISPRASLQGTRRIIHALSAGELVCMFPEGAISRTGQLMEIRRGFELIALKAGVPVVPVAHDGLWGSVFSFSGNLYLFKSPRLLPTPVCVCFGKPLSSQEITTARVRRELLDLGSEAFEERPVLKRHLAREVVCALAKRPWHVEVVDRAGERRQFSAARLLGTSAALSGRLKATVRGRRVGIVLPPGAGGTLANIAVICAGKIPVNLNFTSGRSSLESSLRLAQIDTIITAEVVQRDLKKRAPDFPWPDHVLDIASEIKAAGKARILFWMAAAWMLPNKLVADLLGLPRLGDREEAGLLFTSGSSGEPKGVILSHRNILANCWQICSLSILPNTATILGCLPLFHCFGFTVTLWYPLLRGCSVVTVPSPLDTRKIVDSIREEEATVLIGAPTFLRPLLRRAEPGELRTLDLVVSGAEKLPIELNDAYMERFHLGIMQGYGLTETTMVVNVNQPDPPLTTDTAEPQSGKRLGSVGRMVPGMTARIVDPDTMEELPFTQTGVLLYRGPNVFTGYLKDEEKTKAALRDGWFVTGDLARFDDEGFLYIEGRLSRFSKIGGEMVPHGTIEQKIVDAFGWEQTEAPAAVVVSLPDAAKGEALILLTTKEVSFEEVRHKLAEAGLPNLWIPKIVLRVEKIPVLGTGKLDLKGCKARAAKLTE